MLETKRKSIESEPKPGSRILASGTRPYTRPGPHLERLSVTMQPLPPRQQEILRLAREFGQDEVDDLSARFEVSPQTIRKDRNKICETGMLQRFQSGAMAPSGASNRAS